MKKILKIIFCLSAGLMMGLTVAPTEFWILAWFSLAPLWFLISTEKNNKQVLLCALAWGIGYQGLALSWIAGIHPMTWMGVPFFASLLITAFCLLFITIWGALLVVLWAYLTVLLTKNYKKYLPQQLSRIITGVALWSILEFIWSNGPLWWSPLAYTQSPNNLLILQLGQFSGTTTVTAAIVLVNALFAEALISKINNRSDVKFLFLSSVITLIFLHLIGLILYSTPLTDEPKQIIRVGIIQGNIPNEIKLYPEGWRKAIEGYTTGYKTLAKEGVDIVLTPETALPFFWDDQIENVSSLYQVILTEKVPVWVGAFGRRGQSFTNSLFTIDPKGKTLSRYDKVQLVPLGEYIPFEQILGNLINRLSPLDAHLVAGKTNQLFDSPFGRAIVGICYDSAFSEHFRRQAAEGGEFIITASNNAHYSSSMARQHHAQDVMRAIETNRWAARATNTGYSAIVNPRGKTVWLSGINNYRLHVGEIYKRQTKTLYVKWGDWLTIVLLILGLVVKCLSSVTLG
jgi:apolipoprotein N-acyltransferase